MTVIDHEAGSILRKAFEVLDTFAPDRRTLSLSQITRQSGLPKTTVHRVLQQMQSLGVVDRTGQQYRVGTRMFAWSTPSREVAVRQVALPLMSELSRRYGHTLHLAVLCGADVLYVEKLHSRASTATPSAVA